MKRKILVLFIQRRLSLSFHFFNTNYYDRIYFKSNEYIFHFRQIKYIFVFLIFFSPTIGIKISSHFNAQLPFSLSLKLRRVERPLLPPTGPLLLFLKPAHSDLNSPSSTQRSRDRGWLMTPVPRRAAEKESWRKETVLSLKTFLSYRATIYRPDNIRCKRPPSGVALIQCNHRPNVE